MRRNVLRVEALVGPPWQLSESVGGLWSIAELCFLDSSWISLGPSWGHLGPSRGFLGRLRGHVGGLGPLGSPSCAL
eukprot:4421110-Pyramimonas_sp.AAC.1